MIPAGTGLQERIGRKIAVTGIFIKGVADLPSSASAADMADNIRFMVVHDKQCNGNSALASDVLANVAPGAAWRSFRNLPNTQRFRVLHDEVMGLQSGGGAYEGTGTNVAAFAPVNHPFTVNVTFKKPLVIEYSGVAGGINEIKSNNVFILLASDIAKGRVEFSLRTRFTDM